MRKTLVCTAVLFILLGLFGVRAAHSCQTSGVLLYSSTTDADTVICTNYNGGNFRPTRISFWVIGSGNFQFRLLKSKTYGRFDPVHMDVLGTGTHDFGSGTTMTIMTSGFDAVSVDSVATGSTLYMMYDNCESSYGQHFHWMKLLATATADTVFFTPENSSVGLHYRRISKVKSHCVYNNCSDAGAALPIEIKRLKRTGGPYGFYSIDDDWINIPYGSIFVGEEDGVVGILVQRGAGFDVWFQAAGSQKDDAFK